jgi:hypothetical protein
MARCPCFRRGFNEKNQILKRHEQNNRPARTTTTLPGIGRECYGFVNVCPNQVIFKRFLESLLNRFVVCGAKVGPGSSVQGTIGFAIDWRH